MLRVRYLRRVGFANFGRSSLELPPLQGRGAQLLYVGKSTRSHQSHLAGEENVIGFDALNITTLVDLVSIVRSAKSMRARSLYDLTLP